VEFVLKIAAFGLMKYWSDMWNWLDTIVVFSAIAGYIVMLVQVITKTGGSSGVQSVSGLCWMLHCFMSLNT
jgi:hypothetical protein